MSFQLDLSKSAKTFRLMLDKAGVKPDVIAELIILMDVSSSFEHEHEEGTTSTLIKRLVPVSIVLDPDKMIDVISFSNGPENVTYVGTVTENDCDDFVIDYIIDAVPGWNGGTTYSYAVEEALKRFGWLECDHDHAEGWSRFWNRLTGNQPSPHRHERKRSIIFLVTDGENDPGDRWGDKQRTWQLLEESESRGDDLYVLFIGACEHQDFEWVQKVAARFSNTGIVMATDPEQFVELPDEQLLAKLLVPELVEWLKK